MKKIIKRNIKEKVFIGAVLFYPMLMFTVFYLGINLNSILLAFRKIDMNYSYSFNGFGNFVDVFNSLKIDPILLLSIKNSAIAFFITTIIGFPLNIFFSFYLYKKCFANKTIRFIVMMPSIVSSMVISLIFKKFVETALPDMLNLLFNANVPNLLSNPDTVFTTVLFFMLWTGFSSSLIIYPNAMNAIDQEIIESAKIDGCNNMKELFYIIIPLIYPTITTFVVTGVSSMFVMSGPLVAFWLYDAPMQTYMTGYYLFSIVLGPGSSIRNYPFTAALGLMLTAITLPIVLGVKSVMERNDPTSDASIVRKKDAASGHAGVRK